MISANNNSKIQFKNNDNPFTEIFSLIQRYEPSPDGFPTLAYQTDELKILHQHARNAIGITLQGLQDLGGMMNSFVQYNREIPEELKHIGYFISGIGNLTEALHSLCLNTDFVLRKRGEINY